MTFKTKYSSYNDCEFVADRYQTNGNLALSVTSETEGPITTCTVNTDVTLPEDCIAVKNYSENEGMDKTLADMEIIGEHIGFIKSGWVVIPVYRLTDKGKALWK